VRLAPCSASSTHAVPDPSVDGSGARIQKGSPRQLQLLARISLARRSAPGERTVDRSRTELKASACRGDTCMRRHTVLGGKRAAFCQFPISRLYVKLVDSLRCGSRKSCGRFYLCMGKPDEIESHVPPPTREIWVYRNLGFTVTFVELQNLTNRPPGISPAQWIPLSENAGIALGDASR